MWENVAQMGPMLILAGLTTGFAAETASRRGGYGLIPDMIVGVVGSVLVGGLAWTVLPHHPGMLGMVAVGCAGAGVAIVVQRGLWRSARPGT